MGQYKTWVFIFLILPFIRNIDQSHAETILPPVSANTLSHDRYHGNFGNNNLAAAGNNFGWSGMVTDAAAIPLSVRHWNKTGILKASAIAGITIGLYQYDQKIHDWSQNHRNNGSDKIAQFAEPFGGKHALTPAGLLYLFGYMSNDRKAQHVGMLGIKSVLISGFFTTSLKTYSHRHRPESGDRYNRWDGPGMSLRNLSFPSGHSTAAFAMATVIATEYRNRPFIPFITYGMATMTALSRVHDNKHWASDVFLGSAIGYYTAKVTMKINKGGFGNNVSIAPSVVNKTSGISIKTEF